MPFHIRPFLTLPLASWFLITLLVLSSGPTYAEWVAVASSQAGGGYITYADPDTIRRKGDLAKIWVLTDFTTIQTVADASYLSSRVQKEYDFAEEREHSLAITWFSGNMATGNQVWTHIDEQKWQPVAPKTVGKALWEFACVKK